MNRDIFFPEFDSLVEEKVLVTCGSCPIRVECLQWAIDHEEFGVWGGLTETQRRSLDVSRTRVRCPDCRSDRIEEMEHMEVCISCGLSWPV
jgi:hypothetical protein